MNFTDEQLAELLFGMARAQTAIIEAVDRANAGWRSTHLLPILTVAANVRAAEPRLIDLPSRVLLRMQGRGTVDISAIVADLQRLSSGVPAAAPAAAAAPATPAAAGEMDFTAKS
jgi:hypothetical protein